MSRPTSVHQARAVERRRRESRGKPSYTTDTALQRARLRARAEHGDEQARAALDAYDAAQAAAPEGGD